MTQEQISKLYNKSKSTIKNIYEKNELCLEYGPNEKKEYLVKGYNINVERFKNNGYDPYFDEFLDKIKDLRSSERVL